MKNRETYKFSDVIKSGLKKKFGFFRTPFAVSFSILSLLFLSLFTVHSPLLSAANIGRETYGLLSETYSGLEHGVYNQRNPSDSYSYFSSASVDGGYLGAWGNIALSSDTDSMEGGTSVKAVVGTVGANWWIQFGTPTATYTDMSSYRIGYATGTIDFWVKTTVNLTMEMKAKSPTTTNILYFRTTLDKFKDVEGDPLNTSGTLWQRFSISLSSFPYSGNPSMNIAMMLGTVTTPILFKPAAVGTFWIDGLVWRKPASSPGTFNVEVKNIVDHSAATSLSWSNITLGTTKWKTADQYIKLDLTYYDPNFGIQIYTDNKADDADPKYTGTENPAGLIAADSPASTPLSMAWHIADSTVPAMTVLQGGVCDGDSYSDRLYAQEYGACYPAFIWMKDLNSSGFVNGDSYVTAWDYSDGIQHAEGTWEGNPSPNYLYVAANFTNALTPRTYKTSTLTVELFYE